MAGGAKVAKVVVSRKQLAVPNELIAARATPSAIDILRFNRFKCTSCSHSVAIKRCI